MKTFKELIEDYKSLQQLGYSDYSFKTIGGGHQDAEHNHNTMQKGDLIQVHRNESGTQTPYGMKTEKQIHKVVSIGPSKKGDNHREITTWNLSRGGKKDSFDSHESDRFRFINPDEVRKIHK